MATDSQQGFASDYNNLFTAGGATLVWWQKPFTDLFDWQVEADLRHPLDRHHGVAAHPGQPAVRESGRRRLPPPGRGLDQHRRGRPGQPVNLEPGSNGGRIDLGAYGNTGQAAQSRRQFLRLDYPDYYADWPAAEGRRSAGTPTTWRRRDHTLAGA